MCLGNEYYELGDVKINKNIKYNRSLMSALRQQEQANPQVQGKPEFDPVSGH